MEYRKITITIEREKEIGLVVKEWNNLKIDLSNESTDDIQQWFSTIFENIVENKKSVQFILKDDEKDLFHEIAEDIVSQLNNEIKQSENDFDRLFEISNSVGD